MGLGTVVGWDGKLGEGRFGGGGLGWEMKSGKWGRWLNEVEDGGKDTRIGCCIMGVHSVPVNEWGECVDLFRKGRVQHGLQWWWKVWLHS